MRDDKQYEALIYT